MGYRTRQRYLTKKKKAEDKTSSGSIEKMLAKKQLQLSANDLKILNLIAARGCIHIPTIQANAGGQREDVVKAHMDMLVSAGVIKAELTNARRRPEVIYYMGKRIAYNEISHALYMSEALDRLSTNTAIKILEYKHEHTLKSEHSKSGQASDNLQLPDAALTLENRGEVESGYVEIDSKSYTGKKLKGKVSGLAKYIGDKPLYWICYSTGRLNTIKTAVKGFANIKPIMSYELHTL